MPDKTALSPKVKAQFSIEKQYHLYLERVGLDESRMHPIQRIETKRAFFGAFGQSIALLRDEVSEYDDQQGVAILEDMWSQVGNFFITENGSGN